MKRQLTERRGSRGLFQDANECRRKGFSMFADLLEEQAYLEQKREARATRRAQREQEDAQERGDQARR